MKKIALISVLVMLLLACSVSDVSSILSRGQTPVPLPSAMNTVYVTPSDTPMITATLPTPTFTETPTLVGGGFTGTPTLNSTGLTGTPAITESPVDTLTSPIGTGNSLPTPQYVGFTQVKISGNTLRWGGCEPSSIIFTAQVADPINETAVLLFLGLKNPTTGESTTLKGGAVMNGDNTGTFTYTVTAKNITHYQDFPGGWVLFQMVATNGHLQRLGWTQVYQNNVTISPCS